MPQRDRGASCAGCVHRGAHEPILARVDGELVPVGLILDCRRHAPVAYQSRHNVALTAWPKVRDTDWCGDFELRRA